MSYFDEIAEYSTYSGQDADFHFNYNANSGGGQAFLGGRFYDENGQLVSPETLDGKTATFRYLFRTDAGEEVAVILNDDKAKYEVKPRGNGSTSMKLGVGTDRVAPSKVVSSFMMLPPTCGVKTPSNLQCSILCANNYWLQSMWLECTPDTQTPNGVLFTVKDCVFGGGESKESHDREGRYFKLNIDKRMSDIIELSFCADAFSEEVAAVIRLFAEIYGGQRQFNYDACNEATKSLMEILSQEYPEGYSGVTDPLPFLQEIILKQDGSPDDLEAAFKEWLARVQKPNGELYSENTRNQYISAIKAAASQFVAAIAPFSSIYEITDVGTLDRTISGIRSDVTYEEFNRSRGNGSLSAGLDLYKRFLFEQAKDGIQYKTGLQSDFGRNRILFGAPGTSKSYTLNREKDTLLAEGGEYERVTFHADYSYANFVGTYKPVMVSNTPTVPSDTEVSYVLSVLTDSSKTAQEKYDILFDIFRDEGITRLPILLGLYTDEMFNTRKRDGSAASGDNTVERNHGKAIRKYVNLIDGNARASEIAYEYVPGPFMRVYVKALRNARTGSPKPHLLIIEEINRANVSAVFGDVFQLLDRGDDEVSEYPIQASEDIKKYLAKELGGNPDDYSEIRIPDNMFIWATMNSADQGVFPMDTAFKRRWDFTYLGIDDSETGIAGKKVILGKGEYRRVIEWNALRKAINNELLGYKVNEDKLMGPYFISKKNLPEGDMIDPAAFTRIFKNKVIMYLFDDAAKQKRPSLFAGCDEQAKNQYSKICSEFDTKGVSIFCEAISSQFIDTVPEDDGE